MANEPQKLTPEQLAEMEFLQTTPKDKSQETYIEFKAALREACILPVLCKDKDGNNITKYYRFESTEYTQQLLKKLHEEKPKKTIDDVAHGLSINPNNLWFERGINSKVAGTVSWFLSYHKLDFLASVIQGYISNSTSSKTDFKEKPVGELPEGQWVLDCYEFQNNEMKVVEKKNYIAEILKSFNIEELTKKEVYSLLHDEDLRGNSEEIRYTKREIRKFMFPYAKYNASLLFESSLKDLFKHLQLPEKQKTKRLIPVINKTGFYPEADCYEVQE